MFSRNDVSGGVDYCGSKAGTEGQTGSVSRCLTCGADSLFIARSNLKTSGMNISEMRLPRKHA